MPVASSLGMTNRGRGAIRGAGIGRGATRRVTRAQQAAPLRIDDKGDGRSLTAIPRLLFLCCSYLDPARFNEFFAADLPVAQAAFMAHSQVFNFAENFSAVISKAAWRSKPSWMMVSGSDRTINPQLERWYAECAKSHMVEVRGASHVVYISHPREVAALIEEAARGAK
ncbi:MAG: alpha/beta hydrolase [Candidatus Acidiferrales bacterium]